MIEFQNIEKSFFGVKVLKGVSFAVNPGQTVGIVAGRTARANPR
jgi:ABC-type sugar transport system ATPase subunit